MQRGSGQRCWFAIPFWQRMGAIFEHFWSIFGQFSKIFGHFFGSRVHFCNYVLYVGPRVTFGSQKVPKLKKASPHLGVTFGAFWCLGGSPFFDVFLVPLLDGILVSFGAKVAPQRELLGIILETIW